jgi:hypothetical protein
VAADEGEGGSPTGYIPGRRDRARDYDPSQPAVAVVRPGVSGTLLVCGVVSLVTLGIGAGMLVGAIR